MKPIITILGVLSIVATIAVIWQRQTLAKLPAHHQGFTNEVLLDSPGASDAAQEQEIISLREQTKDLAKLRNEVSRLRSARAEMAGARAESTRLLEAKQNPSPDPAPPPGFTSRQQLANVGFATPEAALKTFFWAMNEGDFEMTMHAVSPESRERKRWDKQSPEQRAALAESFKRDVRGKSMPSFNDVGVHAREDVSEDLVVLHVGSSLSTNTMRMSLQRFGQEWRLQDFPR